MYIISACPRLALKIVDAGKDACNDLGTRIGFHGYGPYEGYPFLRNAVMIGIAHSNNYALRFDLNVFDAAINSRNIG